MTEFSLEIEKIFPQEDGSEPRYIVSGWYSNTRHEKRILLMLREDEADLGEVDMPADHFAEICKEYLLKYYAKE